MRAGSALPPRSVSERVARGFNLIEAAIGLAVVGLAVVGLVIGGIWMVSRSVIQSHKISRSYAFVIETAAGLQSKWHGTQWVGTEYLSSCAVRAGIVPPDFVNPAGYDDCAAGYQNSWHPYIMIHPWAYGFGTGIIPRAGSSITNNGATRSYVLTMTGLPRDVCKQLVTKVTAGANKNGLLISSIRVDWHTYYYADSFPRTLDNVLACTDVCFTIPW